MQSARVFYFRREPGVAVAGAGRMLHALLAALSAHLSYPASSQLRELAVVLEGGVPHPSAWRELRAGPLRAELAKNSNAWDSAERTLDWANRNGAHVLYPSHVFYPKAFANLEQPPAYLMYWGDPVWGKSAGLSVVGTREPSRGALLWLEEHLAPALIETQCLSISGGARGIDQRAHAVSLRAGVPTIAFLPSGLGDIYPRDFASWISAIRDGGGAVISEYPPYEPMRKMHFHRRNRMIAAMGGGLFVVEAARKSGSMMTARLALEFGRPVCVLPSSPLENGAAGTLDLLFDGAQPLRDGRDLVAFIELNAKRGGD